MIYLYFQRWLPETGGANLPALNNLLKPLGIALGDTVLEGNFDLGEHMIYYASGKNSMNIIICLAETEPSELVYPHWVIFFSSRDTYSSISS